MRKPRGGLAGKRRKLEDEPGNGHFEPKWEQSPDPHVDEEFWVTGRCHDYDETVVELAKFGSAVTLEGWCNRGAA